MRGQRHAPAAFYPPGKTRYPLYRRLGGPQSWSGQVRKISPSNGIRPPDRPARSQSLNRLSYRAHNRGRRTVKFEAGCKLFIQALNLILNAAFCQVNNWKLKPQNRTKIGKVLALFTHITCKEIKAAIISLCNRVFSVYVDKNYKENQIFR